MIFIYSCHALYNTCFPSHAASPFPDSRFSLSCLSRLEMAGIQLKKLLQDIPNFHKAAQLPDSAAPPVFKNLSYYSHYNARIEMERVFSRWVAGDSRLPPTWRSLVSVLIELGLAELSQQVEDCLNSMLTMYNEVVL